ncbi:MAG TPA: hypothetical protein GYA06_07355 [Chloroflexi bacterium]|nr:hypothetical protein [Chloroflexota bacterium]
MTPASELTGWLFDLYADPQDGVTLWLLGDDGRRHRLRQAFPITFYAAGPPARLRELCRFLKSQPVPVELAREERRRDLFQPSRQPLLAVRVLLASDQPRLFRQVARRFPDLTYYDADVHLSLRHAAVYGTFPLARCRVQAGPDGTVTALEVLDSPWDLDPPRPELRILEMEPDVDPARGEPAALELRSGRLRYRLPLRPARPLLVNLRAILQRLDPDLLLTNRGDTWLLPLLLDLSEEHDLPLPLNRAPGRGVARRGERSYFSYGRIVYRGSQVMLFGRWHIDRANAMMWNDYALEGVLESARVTSLPVQEAARLSPGTGISSMQIRQALVQGVLVPWRKQQSEQPKTALQLIESDQGGMVYQPLIGVYSSVGALDFISMYPSIMVRCNISPETVPLRHVEPSDADPGLVPRTLAPLLEKRVALKHRLAGMPGWDPRRATDKARSSAQKWLLVTCFGYLGYKNARFGQIEAHEAVTAYGREALMRAKEAAEDHGFTVLHMYVDGLWLHRPGASQPADFEPVLMDILERTGLPVSLDGIYKWVAFLPSRVDERTPVPNRYFGAFQDGSIKVRGLACRRHDSPAWVGSLQMRLIEIFAKAGSAEELPDYLNEALNSLHRDLTALSEGRVPLEELLVTQRLSRALDRYTSPSPAARAALQLRQVTGREMRPGQKVRFLFTRGEPGVHAWDLPEPPDPRQIDRERYRELALRAAREVLEGLRVLPPEPTLLPLEKYTRR